VATELPIWLLDVDGVVNAWDAGWGEPQRVQKVMSKSAGRSFNLHWAPELIARIQQIQRDGLAEIRWCTTWCPDAGVLENLWQLPALPRAWESRPLNGRAAAMAKLGAACQVLAEKRRLVWTDDGEAPESGELYDRLTFDGQALLIAPDHRRGLQPEDLDRIEAFVSYDAARAD
jgi:hypothetical protein